MKARARWTLMVEVYPRRLVTPREAKAYSRRSAELLEHLGYTATVVGGEVEVLARKRRTRKAVTP